MSTEQLKRQIRISLADLREEERLRMRDMTWCKCRSSRIVFGPTYLGHRSCRVCGKFVR